MSQFKESEHPRDDDGKFTDGDFFSGEEKGDKKEDFFEEKQKQSNKKMTPAEKIASVHIDFDRDNILPELNDDTRKKMNVDKNKPVLLKSATIKRNLGKHLDVAENEMENIITEALYNPIDVFPANPDNANYYHLASFVEIKEKNGLKMGLVLLDVDDTKDNFEIGHAYFVDSKGFDKTRNKVNKKD